MLIMKMKMSKIKRIELLRAMNTVALTCNNEDCIDNFWLYAMPDHADDDDFDFIADDDEKFNHVCEAFSKMIEMLHREGMYVEGKLY